jgi:RecJ-like exonuclease
MRDLEKLRECSCVPCPECGGTGDVWWSFSGRYLGRFRCDDLDERDTCSECDGTGLLEMCQACLDAEWVVENDGTLRADLCKEESRD